MKFTSTMTIVLWKSAYLYLVGKSHCPHTLRNVTVLSHETLYDELSEIYPCPLCNEENIL